MVIRTGFQFQANIDKRIHNQLGLLGFLFFFFHFGSYLEAFINNKKTINSHIIITNLTHYKKW